MLDPTGSSTPNPSTPISSRRSPTQVRSMARDVVGLYIRLLSSFFTLSSPSASPSESSTSGKPPAFVPRDTNSLTAGIWSNRILTEIVEAGNELSLGDIGSEAMDEWQGLIDSTRWRTVEVICETWRLGESLAFLRNLKMDRLLNICYLVHDPQTQSSSIHSRTGCQIQRSGLLRSTSVACKPSNVTIPRPSTLQ